MTNPPKWCFVERMALAISGERFWCAQIITRYCTMIAFTFLHFDLHTYLGKSSILHLDVHFDLDFQISLSYLYSRYSQIWVIIDIMILCISWYHIYHGIRGHNNKHKLQTTSDPQGTCGLWKVSIAGSCAITSRLRGDGGTAIPLKHGNVGPWS